MEKLNGLTSTTVKKQIRHSFVLFGLLVVLSYIFATIVVLRSNIINDGRGTVTTEITNSDSSKFNNKRDSSRTRDEKQCYKISGEKDTTISKWKNSRVTHTNTNNMQIEKDIFVLILIGGIAVLHVLLFGLFLCFVEWYYETLYGILLNRRPDQQ